MTKSSFKNLITYAGVGFWAFAQSCVTALGLELFTSVVYFSRYWITFVILFVTNFSSIVLLIKIHKK